ncbi:CYTA protein, partial [Geococcyx californianus]|nr:CYTA protein [Geococcyx californianus]
QVKPQLEKKLNRTYPIFKAVEYRTQVVAGVNYCIKVQVSDDEYVHLLVFQALPQENQGPKLVRYWTGKSQDDPLN